MREVQSSVRLVGGGEGRKMRLLIERCWTGRKHTHLPVDISRAALEKSSGKLLSACPELQIAQMGEFVPALKMLVDDGRMSEGG